MSQSQSIFRESIDEIDKLIKEVKEDLKGFRGTVPAMPEDGCQLCMRAKIPESELREYVRSIKIGKTNVDIFQKLQYMIQILVDSYWLSGQGGHKIQSDQKIPMNTAIKIRMTCQKFIDNCKDINPEETNKETYESMKKEMISKLG
jgi:hypothetical protein